MQGIEVSPSWKDFGNSLRVTHNQYKFEDQEVPSFSLLKTKSIDVFQNHQNIIKKRLNKPKKSHLKQKNSCSGSKKLIGKFRNENCSSGKKKLLVKAQRSSHLRQQKKLDIKFSIMNVDEEDEDNLLNRSPEVGAFDGGNSCITTKSGGTFSESISLSQVDTLRIPQVQKKSYQGDRFIPLRPKGSEEQNYEMQFQHEENMLRYQTQQRKSKKRNKQEQMSPNSEQDNVINDDESVNNSPNSSSNSKGSPNEEKNKQIYQNLLAQQCLGKDIFSLDSQFENLSDPLLARDQQDLMQTNPKASVFDEYEQDQSYLNVLGPNRNNKNLSPGHFQLQSKKCILRYNENDKENSTLGQTSFDETYNPLKLNHGLGFDWDPIDSFNEGFNVESQKTRKINKMPFKVLDAPQLQDDFYLNLVDWSQQNVLAVGLNRAVYIWSACTSQVKKLTELPQDDQITSVGWSNRGQHLAIGTNQGDTQIWDTNHCKIVRTFGGHLGRVSAVSWNGSTVTTGSRDRMILSRDLRVKNAVTHRHAGHKQEVCGLKWSFDGQQLASGGNDNKLMIWNMHSESAQAKFSEHQAAVKAIAWNPNQHGLLATGGGTADRCIRFWNTHSLQPINYVDTGSQVCNLMFSKTTNEIVSTHGYSLNQIIVWKYPTMQKIATLTGHTYRVLYLSMSPCGSNIVTGAGDETLRFWSLFPSIKSEMGGITGQRSSLFPSNMDIR